MQIKGELTTILTELTTGDKMVWASIVITCEGCGTLTYTIPGHHLRMVRDMVTEALDTYGDIGGESTRVGDRVTTTVRPPKDPTQN